MDKLDGLISGVKNSSLSYEAKILIKIESIRKDMKEMDDILSHLETNTYKMQKLHIHEKRLAIDSNSELLKRLPLRKEHLLRDIESSKKRLLELTTRINELNKL